MLGIPLADASRASKRERESNFFTIGNSKEKEIAKWNLKILDNTPITVTGKNEA